MCTRKKTTLDLAGGSGLLSDIRKLKILMKSQFLETWSYGKLPMVRKAVNWSVLEVITLYFVGLTFGGNLSGWVAEYGGDYFMFAFLGIVMNDFGSIAFNSTSGFLLSAERRGFMESLFVSPTSLWIFAISHTLSGTLEAVVRSSITFMFAIFILGGSIILELEAVLLSCLFFLLFISSTFFLGLMSAGFSVIVKQNVEPISTTMNWINRLLSGVYYPVTILPLWIQGLASVLPQTHAISGLRLVLLGGMTWQPAVIDSLLFLIGLNVPFFILGIALVRFGLKFAKQQGNLGYY